MPRKENRRARLIQFGNHFLFEKPPMGVAGGHLGAIHFLDGKRMRFAYRLSFA